LHKGHNSLLPNPNSQFPQKEAQTNPRSKKEITDTFEAAGIIDKKGDLKKPYKDIHTPVSK
jgi:hypothetical protein